MTESFFHALETHHVAYLLISGQATVLYGAATFSEDIDIWVEPSEENCIALLAALASVRARYYKLTPPLRTEFMRRGHGFHFTVEDDPVLYIDVMGRPPRAPSFAEARLHATVFPTPWGKLPTVGIRHLADIKRTQRLSDYPIIGALARCALEAGSGVSETDADWAVRNVYSSEDLDAILAIHPAVADACRRDENLQVAAEYAGDGALPADVVDALEAYFFARMSAARRADREYWRDIIDELRDLRREERLIPEGQPVIAP